MAQAEWPSTTEVERIIAIADPVLMNLSITVGYSRLSKAFSAWLSGGANWCAFGTWASKQAGCTIRKEDFSRLVARRMQARLAGHPILGEAQHLFDVPIERLADFAGEVSQGLPGIDRASDALARGNRMVFGDIAAAFARFGSAVVANGGSAMPAFSAHLRPGPLPDGQDLLRDAFTSYVSASQSVDAGQRAQFIFLANVQIAIHEQTRVQPLVREAMDAALLDVADTRRRILERLDEVLSVGPVGVLHTGAGRRVANAVADTLAEELRIVARMIITDHMMTMELPGGRILRLGSDVRGTFPPSLASPTNQPLIDLLETVDSSANTTRGSAAIDWSILLQRLHYIVDFFRAYQEDAGLYSEPFEPPQLTAIAAGRVPDRF